MNDDAGRQRARASRWARWERPLVVLLGTLGVARVLLFALSFPFFANTDEGAHFDALVKYAHGHLPREVVATYEEESARLIVLYGSREFYQEIPPHPPLWLAPEPVQRGALQSGLGFWLRAGNHEAYQPPLYYWLAGGWYHVGELIGLEGLSLLYWLRGINGLIFGLLFGVAYLYCRTFLPDRVEARLAVLMLLAAFPNDLFFVISNDVLSPLGYLVALFLLLGLFTAERGRAYHLVTGLSVAGAFLVKLTNVGILLIALLLFLLRANQRLGSGGAGRGLAGQGRGEAAMDLTLLALGVTLPVSLWLGWNAIAVGDVTGHARISAGWTPKPLAALFEHPIFTWTGASMFFRELVTSYWRGELFWHGERLASSFADRLYLFSTLLFGGTGIVLALREGTTRAGLADVRRLADGACALSVLAGVAFLVWISIAFDFGDWWYPSRELPFLMAGRLISGSLVPFLLLYVNGLDRLLGRLFARPPTLAVATIVALVALGSELAISRDVFGSEFNWLSH